MTPDLRLLAYAVVLTWLMIMVAATLRARMWTVDGLKLAFGNRGDLPEPSELAGRADRAAKNMLENLAMFIGLVIVAHASGADHDRTVLGARLFFWARVVYYPVYLIGVPYLRTAVWAVSVVGMGLIFMASM